jgi:hypothetical protein
MKVRHAQALARKADTGTKVRGLKSKGFLHRNSITYMTTNMSRSTRVSLHCLRNIENQKTRMMTRY